MAAGDVTTFSAHVFNLGEKLHDLDGDSFKLAFITTATTPTKATADPHWGGTGTTDMSTNEVSGTGYTAGGFSLNAAFDSAGKFDLPDLNWPTNPAGPTDARWGILYNDTLASKKCVLFLDLGSIRDLQAVTLDVVWAAAGVSLHTVP